LFPFRVEHDSVIRSSPRNPSRRQTRVGKVGCSCLSGLCFGTIARHCRHGGVLAVFGHRRPALITNMALFWQSDDRLLQASETTIRCSHPSPTRNCQQPHILAWAYLLPRLICLDTACVDSLGRRAYLAVGTFMTKGYFLSSWLWTGFYGEAHGVNRMSLRLGSGWAS
jgi:hypothetical protein